MCHRVAWIGDRVLAPLDAVLDTSHGHQRSGVQDRIDSIEAGHREFAASSAGQGVGSRSTPLDILIRLADWKRSTSISCDNRNFRNDFSWNRHVCAMPSNSRYWTAASLKNVPEIFRCIARCLMALSAILLFHGIPSSSRKRNKDSRYRARRFWYFFVTSRAYSLLSIAAA